MTEGVYRGWENIIEHSGRIKDRVRNKLSPESHNEPEEHLKQGGMVR